MIVIVNQDPEGLLLALNAVDQRLTARQTDLVSACVSSLHTVGVSMP